MALIGRIRKNFWFVLLVLGLALAAFVIMDMVNAGNRGGLGPQQVVGEVAGQKIDYMDFQKVEQALYANNADNFAAKSGVWNYLVEKAIINDQADALGLGVSKDELMDLQFGSNLSPIIQNTFRNPQTGQVDMQQLLNIKQAIENGEELSSTFRLSWSEQEKQIAKTAKQEKLIAMVSKAMTTPSVIVEANEKNTNSSVSFDYVKVPFDQIDNSEVSLTDADVTAYINANKSQYTYDDEQRSIAYVVKDVIPTAADSAGLKARVASLVTEFEKKNPSQDSIFAINNQGQYSPVYLKNEDLQESIKEVVNTMSVGSVYGPYEDGGAYFAVKLIDKKVYPDSVTTRHILRGVANGDPAQTIAANTYLDSLENLINTSRETIGTLAAANSQDQSSSANDGILGPFAQASMISLEYSKKAFETKKGELFRVTSTFGQHLVEVTDIVYNDRDPKYKLAFVRMPITPSSETQDKLEDEMSDMVEGARTLKALEEAVAGRNDMSLETAASVGANDYVFGAFGSGNTSRDIIKWAFDQDTEVGNVSPSIYTYTDKVNYFNSKYVLAALKSVTDPGLASAAAVKDQSEIAITNWKKGQMLVSKISGTDLNAIASQYGTTVQSSSNTKFSSSSIAGLGNEPDVIAAAFAQGEGTVSAPIHGNNGVYIVKTTAVAEGAVASIPSVRRNMTNANRSRASFSLMNSLKKMFKPEDNRSKFF